MEALLFLVELVVLMLAILRAARDDRRPAGGGGLFGYRAEAECDILPPPSSVRGGR